MYRRLRHPVFVGCEGKSELGYVRWLNRLATFENIPVAITARNMKGGDPEAIAYGTVKSLRKIAGGPATFNKKYLFLDFFCNARTREKIKAARRIAKRNGISIMWQPICHECFLAKHFVETERRNPRTADECEATLRVVWPDYRKGLDATEYEKHLAVDNLVRARANLPELDAFLRDIGWR